MVCKKPVFFDDEELVGALYILGNFLFVLKYLKSGKCLYGGV
jgi:hypothetical protein